MIKNTNFALAIHQLNPWVIHVMAGKKSDPDALSRREQKAATRRKIIKATARMIRDQGIDGTNVNDVMNEVGLTRGSFYAHFDSKEALINEAYVAAMGEGRGLWFNDLEEESIADYMAVLLERYCNPRHRAKPSTGCAMPALGSEIGLLEDNDELKRTFGEELLKSAGLIEARLADEPSIDTDSFPAEDRALALLSGLVGSMVLARAVGSNKLSNKILDATKQQFAEYYSGS